MCACSSGSCGGIDGLVLQITILHSDMWLVSILLLALSTCCFGFSLTFCPLTHTKRQITLSRAKTGLSREGIVADYQYSARAYRAAAIITEQDKGSPIVLFARRW